VKRLVLACASALLFSVVVSAHHSYTAFDQENAVTLTGTIHRITIRNPHTVLELDTIDGQRYQIEWGSAFQLAYWGVDAKTLHSGDRIVIIGYVMRDKTQRRMSLVRMVRRVEDGWQWGEPPAPTQ
jgi:hypothetical protein